MPMMNLRVAQPDCLVDLNAVAGLDDVSIQDNEVSIGAMTRYAALHQSPIIQQHLPLMVAAITHIAHPAIRNRGTIGGSAALADPAAEMPAILVALDATVELRSKQGSRTVAANEFFLDIYETAREADEIIVNFRLPLSGERAFGFYEIARRHGDYASAGAIVTAEKFTPFTDLRVVMFGVSEKPERLCNLESTLQGTGYQIDDIAVATAQSLSAVEFADSLDLSIETRVQHANVALQRAFKQMCSSTESSGYQ